MHHSTRLPPKEQPLDPRYLRAHWVRGEPRRPTMVFKYTWGGGEYEAGGEGVGPTNGTAKPLKPLAEKNPK